MSDTEQQRRYSQGASNRKHPAGAVASSLDFDENLDIPIEELVRSLMSCGDMIRHEIYNMNENRGLFTGCNAKSAIRSLMASEEDSTASESGCSPSLGEGIYGYPRFDSPYREKGKWPTSQATYFLRARSGTPSSAPSIMGPHKTLSANAPVFTPLSDIGNHATPGSLSADLWELPGLPSPMMEFTEAPSFDSRDINNNHYPKEIGASVSILQRGLSSIAIGGKYLHL